MRSSAFASGDLEAGRGLIDRARLLLEMTETPLHGRGATARRTTQTRRGPMALAGSEERAVGRAPRPLTTMHAPFPTEVECKMHGHSPENFESHDPP
jgi:hypothetical protein